MTDRWLGRRPAVGQRVVSRHKHSECAWDVVWPSEAEETQRHDRQRSLPATNHHGHPHGQDTIDSLISSWPRGWPVRSDRWFGTRPAVRPAPLVTGWASGPAAGRSNQSRWSITVDASHATAVSTSSIAMCPSDIMAPFVVIASLPVVAATRSRASTHMLADRRTHHRSRPFRAAQQQERIATDRQSNNSRQMCAVEAIILRHTSIGLKCAVVHTSSHPRIQTTIPGSTLSTSFPDSPSAARSSDKHACM